MELSHRFFSKLLRLRLRLRFIHMCLYTKSQKGWCECIHRIQYNPIYVICNRNTFRLRKKLVWMDHCCSSCSVLTVSLSTTALVFPGHLNFRFASNNLFSEVPQRFIWTSLPSRMFRKLEFKKCHEILISLVSMRECFHSFVQDPSVFEIRKYHIHLGTQGDCTVWMICVLGHLVNSRMK